MMAGGAVQFDRKAAWQHGVEFRRCPYSRPDLCFQVITVQMHFTCGVGAPDQSHTITLADPACHWTISDFAGDDIKVDRLRRPVICGDAAGG